MKKLLMSLSCLFLLGACTTLNQGLTPEQITLEVSCTGYDSAMSALTAAAKLKKLSAQQIANVNQIRTVVYPTCGPFLASASDPSLLPNGSPKTMLNQVLNSIASLEKMSVTVNPTVKN